eukprot:364283-Chlamydomonas_euryale.AAC.33
MEARSLAMAMAMLPCPQDPDDKDPREKCTVKPLYKYTALPFLPAIYTIIGNSSAQKYELMVARQPCRIGAARKTNKSTPQARNCGVDLSQVWRPWLQQLWSRRRDVLGPKPKPARYRNIPNLSERLRECGPGRFRKTRWTRMCGARAACPERVKIVSCRLVRITDASGIVAGPLSICHVW